MAGSGFLSFTKFRPGSQGMVFLLCFLLAAAIWVVNALSKSYVTTYTFNVITRASAKNDGEAVRVSLRGSGFSLLRLFYRMNNSSFEKYTSHQLSTHELADSIIGDLRSNVQVMRVEPALISGILSEGFKSKKVAVKGNVTVNYASQFGSLIPVMYKPDSIEITGPSKVIDSIRYLETVSLKINDLDHRLFRSVPLKVPHQEVILPMQSVWMYVMAERFTEQRTEVPVSVPASKFKVLPDKVTITYNVPLSRFNDIKPSQFKVGVNTSVQLEKGMYPLKVRNKPFYVRNLSLDPDKVSLLQFE